MVVRAYLAPLHENKVCKKVAVTNCSMTSHACAVRVGWINDGVIRNCSFSNLNITDSPTGLVMYLPANPNPARMSDQGFESTLIENITFSNITIDRYYYAPVRILICEHNQCTAIRNIYFDNVHARGACMPVVEGRADCHVQNVYFTNCQITQVPYEQITTKFAARMAKLKRQPGYIRFKCVDNLVLSNTTFNAL